MAWKKGDWFTEVKKGDRLSLVYSLQVSTFLGEEKVSLSVEDIKA